MSLEFILRVCAIEHLLQLHYLSDMILYLFYSHKYNLQDQNQKKNNIMVRTSEDKIVVRTKLSRFYDIVQSSLKVTIKIKIKIKIKSGVNDVSHNSYSNSWYSNLDIKKFKIKNKKKRRKNILQIIDERYHMQKNLFFW